LISLPCGIPVKGSDAQSPVVSKKQALAINKAKGNQQNNKLPYAIKIVLSEKKFYRESSASTSRIV
jgi:hypothetical protein